MKVKVLVIDDETSLCNIIKKILSSEDFDVLSVYNGRDGLKKIDEFKPDIVLTDIVMPDMDGLELILKVSKENPDIKIIAMSGNFVGKDYLETAKEFGASEVLVKPFDRNDLILKVKKVIN